VLNSEIHYLLVVKCDMAVMSKLCHARNIEIMQA